MFVVLGWALGRLAAFALVIVLALCTGLSSAAGAASAPVWAIGTVVAVLLASTEVRASIRQLKAIKQLAVRLRDGSTVEVGPNAVAAERRALTHGRWVTAGLAASSVVLWGWFAVQWSIAAHQVPPEDGGLFEPLVSFVAGPVSVLTLISAARNLWRWWAHRQARQVVWAVPCGGGPVWASGLDPSYGDGIDPKDSEAPCCSCRVEAERHDIDGEEDWGTGRIPADDYCLVHGIDAVNSLDHGTFRALARFPWLWDGSSKLPSLETDPPETATGLLAFAGHAFGGIPVERNGNVMDSVSPRTAPAEELNTADAGIPQWVEPEFLPPHERGILDIIDLTPAGLPGTATRYRHGRAWHTP
jgi:hypothetical protein